MITKPLSIINDGSGFASVVQSNPGQVAIAVNAGPTDKVFLSGLTIDGIDVAGGGIVVNSAGAVEIRNCSIRHFGGVGIHLKPTNSSLVFTLDGIIVSGIGPLVSGSIPPPGGSAILVQPINTDSVSGIIRNTLLDTNVRGISLYAGTRELDVAVFDSLLDAHTHEGIYVESENHNANAKVLLDGVKVTHTGPVNPTGFLGSGAGLFVTERSVVTIRNSVFAGNWTGIFTNLNATVESLGNNLVRGNQTDFGGRSVVSISPN